MANNWSANSVMNRKEKVIFWIVWGIVYAISLLPLCILYLFSDMLFLLAYHVIGYRKKVIDHNLKSSFPEKSEEELKEIKRLFYKNFCDWVFETIKLASANKWTIGRRVKYNGMENVLTPIKEGKGVVLYLAHYCNWEWITTIGLHLPPECFGGQVYHVLESKVMDKIMLKLRNRMGPVSIPMAEVLRRLIREKNNGKYPVIGFISDQSPLITSTPYWTEFLCHSTPFISGTERLAKKLDMACVYLDIKKVRRGYYEVDVIPMAVESKQIPDWELTEQYARLLEQSIMRDPSCWLWSHNRWKRRPEEFRNTTIMNYEL